jgi:hypothetical protein
MKGWSPGNGWGKTETGYISPCGNYTVSPVGVVRDDGTGRQRVRPFFRLRRISDGADFGLHHGVVNAVAAAERDVRRRAARAR